MPHTLTSLRFLLSLLNVKGRRECMASLDALLRLLTEGKILNPNAKLVAFDKQPIGALYDVPAKERSRSVLSFMSPVDARTQLERRPWNRIEISRTPWNSIDQHDTSFNEYDGPFLSGCWRCGPSKVNSRTGTARWWWRWTTSSKTPWTTRAARPSPPSARSSRTVPSANRIS